MKKVERITLDGNWMLMQAERSIKITAQTPGTVFEALLENKIIEDPFYGENEHEMAWIFESDWSYEGTFEVEEKFLEHSSILLRFHGLDTIARVTLNGSSLGSTNNMFITHDFDVKTLLKNGINVLKLEFTSPTRKAREEIELHGDYLNTGQDALPGVPYLRKAQYSFGWDWGPKLPDIGIFRPIELIGFDTVKIESVHAIQKFTYNENPLENVDPERIPNIKIESVQFKVNVEVDSTMENIETLGYTLHLSLKLQDKEIITKNAPLRTKVQSFEFTINGPQLWWTHDLGTPELHDLTVSITSAELIDYHSQKIGVRDLQLVRKPDKWGETFYFLLNGVPVFAKGANWIPVDSFIPRGKRLGLYQQNLKDAKEANMNCIRVWGGGIYEEDLFYDLCDELGFLVWQDFPFACAIYPYHEEFVENVKIEASQNIKRLRHHPSLALWCGNNEIEVMWVFALVNTQILNSNEFPNYIKRILDAERSAKVKAYEEGYAKMFNEILPRLVKTHDPTRPYWPSSPSNANPEKPIDFENANSTDFGDMHNWSVWHGGKAFSTYRTCDSRFVSEFGFESFPSLKTIKEFCPPDQFDFKSPIMQNHQKNAAGNSKIMRYMKKRFSIPQKFEQQVILSQITQAEAIEYGVEHWRQNRNENHCMGALYWQLNDCWPVASWASLDYFGRWKALHYLAKRFYQPLFASVKEEQDLVEFWVTNDGRTPRTVTLTWSILNSGGIQLMSGSKSMKVPPCSSRITEEVDTSTMNKDKNEMRNNVIFYSLRDNENNNSIIIRGFRLFDHPKFFTLKDPQLSHMIEKLPDKNEAPPTYRMTIIAKSIALYVHIESDIVDFLASDNFFSMEPEESRTIILKIINNKKAKNVSNEIISNSFKVQSLYDLK